MPSPEQLVVRSRTATPPRVDGTSLPTTQTSPFVTIAVPSLNEQDYIASCLHSLVGQWPAGAYEILVMDGGSTDATRDIVSRLASENPAIRLVHNAQRIQSAAVNLAARLASPRAAVLLRADAHAVYPRDFVSRCVAELLRTGATSVVVPMRNMAQPGHPMQRAIAAAQSSRLGNGGAAHRASGASGFIDHGHHAAFDRTFFLSVGGYDETFTHNEDAEFDHRARRAGGRIWMCGDLPVTYYPRKDLRSLARQYARHGRGRARTLMAHGLWPRPRQMAPVAALLGCTAGIAAAPFLPAASAAALAYPAACVGWGVVQAVRRRDAWLAAAGLAGMVMHLSWATGFLLAIAERGAKRSAAPKTL